MKCFHALFISAAFALAMPVVAQDALPKPTVPVAKAAQSPNRAPQDPDAKDGSLRPLSATLHLVSGTKLEGTLLNATELVMKTSFGDASIPLNEVAGIRLAEQGNGTTTVVLHNGDSITGGTELEKLDIVTEWGQAEVNGTNISSILFTQGVTWMTATGFAGSRWALTDTKKATVSTTTRQPTATRRTTTQTPGYPYPVRSAPTSTIRSR